jgi:plastocyanin
MKTPSDRSGAIVRVLSIGLLGVILLMIGSGTTCQPQEPGPEAEFDVAIEGYAYIPAEITISVGSTVTWYNKDPDIHTVTAQEGTFDSGNMARGDTFSYTFEAIGTFEYYCIPHPYMTAKVIVEESAGG